MRAVVETEGLEGDGAPGARPPPIPQKYLDRVQLHLDVLPAAVVEFARSFTKGPLELYESASDKCEVDYKMRLIGVWSVTGSRVKINYVDVKVPNVDSPPRVEDASIHDWLWLDRPEAYSRMSAVFMGNGPSFYMLMVGQVEEVGLPPSSCCVLQ